MKKLIVGGLLLFCVFTALSQKRMVFGMIENRKTCSYEIQVFDGKVLKACTVLNPNQFKIFEGVFENDIKLYFRLLSGNCKCVAVDECPQCKTLPRVYINANEFYVMMPDNLFKYVLTSEICNYP